MAAASLFAAHLLSQHADAAINLPLQWTPACNDGKIAAGQAHSSSKPRDMRTQCTDCCPHCSRFCPAVVLLVLSMLNYSTALALLLPLTVNPHQAVICSASRKEAPLATSALDANSSCLLLSSALQSTSRAPNLPNSSPFGKSSCMSYSSNCRPNRSLSEQVYIPMQPLL